MPDHLEFLMHSLGVLSNAARFREFPVNQITIQLDVVEGMHVITATVPGRVPYKQTDVNYSTALATLASRWFNGE